MGQLPSGPARPAYPRPTPVMIVRWLCRMALAFLLACAGLIAGFAPYTSDMSEVLGVSGMLLLAAAACGLTDHLLGRARM